MSWGLGLGEREKATADRRAASRLTRVDVCVHTNILRHHVAGAGGLV